MNSEAGFDIRWSLIVFIASFSSHFTMTQFDGVEALVSNDIV